MSPLDLRPGGGDVVVRAEGLVLREWTLADAPTMVALFDTEEMDRFTPLASPFDLQAALAYLENARRLRRESGTLQLSVHDPLLRVGSGPSRDDPTPTDGSSSLEAMGEVIVFSGSSPQSIELAYAVGAPFQGHGLARRAVAAVLGLAADSTTAGSAAIERAELVITTDNLRSNAVAAACGFIPSDAPLADRSRKGRTLTMQTWTRSLPQISMT